MIRKPHIRRILIHSRWMWAAFATRNSSRPIAILGKFDRLIEFLRKRHKLDHE